MVIEANETLVRILIYANIIAITLIVIYLSMTLLEKAINKTMAVVKGAESIIRYYWNRSGIRTYEDQIEDLKKDKKTVMMSMENIIEADTPEQKLEAEILFKRIYKEYYGKEYNKQDNE